MPFFVPNRFRGLRLLLNNDPAQVVPNAVLTPVVFTSTSYDTESAAAASIVTIPKGVKYTRLNGYVEFANNAVGNRSIEIFRGGFRSASSAVISAAVFGAITNSYVITGDFVVPDANEQQIQMFVQQTSGGNLNLLIATLLVEFFYT